MIAWGNLTPQFGAAFYEGIKPHEGGRTVSVVAILSEQFRNVGHR
jgi:hypothetical protein